MDLTDQLSMVIPAIEFAGVPIADFARFVSDLAAMPVTLDLDAMLVAGLAADTALDAHLRDVTVDQFLRAVLEPHHLRYRVLTGHIIIAPAPRGESDWVRETYEVSDLAADDDQLALWPPRSRPSSPRRPGRVKGSGTMPRRRVCSPAVA